MYFRLKKENHWDAIREREKSTRGQRSSDLATQNQQQKHKRKQTYANSFIYNNY